VHYALKSVGFGAGTAYFHAQRTPHAASKPPHAPHALQIVDTVYTSGTGAGLGSGSSSQSAMASALALKAVVAQRWGCGVWYLHCPLSTPPRTSSCASMFTELILMQGKVVHMIRS
jgi:hypothetical protein